MKTENSIPYSNINSLISLGSIPEVAKDERNNYYCIGFCSEGLLAASCYGIQYSLPVGFLRKKKKKYGLKKQFEGSSPVNKSIILFCEKSSIDYAVLALQNLIPNIDINVILPLVKENSIPFFKWNRKNIARYESKSFVLEEVKVIDDAFVLSSGITSQRYFDVFSTLLNPDFTLDMYNEYIIKKKFDAIISFANGGIPLGTYMSYFHDTPPMVMDHKKQNLSTIEHLDKDLKILCVDETICSGGYYIATLSKLKLMKNKPSLFISTIVPFSNFSSELDVSSALEIPSKKD